MYLEPTIRDVLSKSRGEIEVIAVLDGYLPDPPIDIKDDRVTFLHYEKSIGQRPAINEAARRAKGKYILKTDAHSMFDEGFDVKLAADCESDWTVIPRMYNMDIKKWEPKRRRITDYMWIRSPDAKDKPLRHNYFRDGKTFARVWPDHWSNYKKWYRKRPLIDDVMTGQGACFFMYLDRFWELEGLDEAHGQWGQMGVELACKAWLSGGRQVVNKKTWFSHWFRGGGGPGFPWPMDNKTQDEARDYSIDLWSNNKWPLQKHPLSWLADKFSSCVAPLTLPTWNGEKKMATKVWIPYKDNRDPKPWTQAYALLQCKRPIKEIRPATIKSLRGYPDDPWFVKARKFNVKTLHESRLRFAGSVKADGIRWQVEVVPPFVKRILNEEKFDDKKLKTLGYYDYLVSRLNPLVHPPEGPTPKGVRHVLNQMKDMIKLVYSMENEGLRAPIDLFITGDIIEKNGEKRDRVVLCRGGRRIPIAYYLGWEKIQARIWRTKHLSRTLIPTNKWPDEDGTITKIAADQFAKYGSRATDKYWKHGYTYLYDRKFAELKPMNTLKILELGVQRGSSLKMWQDAFPQAEVFGIDEKDRVKSWFKDDRIKIFEGNEKDTKFVKKVAEKYGPFNIIIDDCDHSPISQRIAFDTLWPYVCSNKNRGGIYVIEDFHHNYKDIHKDNNMRPLLKDLIDNLYLKNEVKDISFHPNIIFITKA